MRKSGFGSVRSLLAAAAACALPLGVAWGEPGTPPAAETAVVSADRAMSRANELIDQGRLVQAERLLHAMTKATGDSMSDADAMRLMQMMSKITVGMRQLTPSQVSLQKAEADLGSGDLRSAISYANLVLTSPSALEAEKASAQAVHDVATAQQAQVIPQVREDLFAGVDAFGAGSYTIARDRLTRVVRSGVELAAGEKALLDTYTGKLNAMAEATGEVRLGVFGADDDDEKIDWLLQDSGSQPTDPIQDSNRAEAMTILAEADRAMAQSQYTEAQRKYTFLLQNYRQYLSVDDLARVEQSLQRATMEIGGTPTGDVLQEGQDELEQVRERARTMYNSQIDQANQALSTGDFTRARNAAAQAQLTANQYRNYLPEAEFSAMLDRAATTLNTIVQSEDEARRRATEDAATRLAEEARLRGTAELENRNRMINEALGRVRALQMELRYEEALQIVDQILSLDPLNPAGLLLKDVLEDSIIYRQYLNIQRQKAHSYAEETIGNERALIAPETIIGYPADWPNISLKRGEPMQFSESAVNRAVLATMSEQRIPVNFADNGLENVIAFIAQVSNLNIDVDWSSLELIGVDRESPVTLKLTNVSLETVLDRVLEKVSDPDIPAGWAVTDGILTIASDEVLRRNTVLEIYDIRDLLIDIPDYTEAPTFDLNSVLQSSGGRGGGGGRSPFSGGNQDDDVERRDRQEMIDEIVDIISSNVDYEGWLENGGDTGSMREFNGNLIITNTPKNHRSIIALLSKLREVRALQINVEVRFLLVAQDFFEQIGFDLDVYLNADNNEFGIARTLDPSLLPSDYFDEQGNLVRRVGSGNFDLNGDGTLQPVGAPGAAGDFVPVFAPGTQGDEFSIIRGAQNSFSLTNLLAAGSSFAGEILSESPALGITGQFLDDIQVDFMIQATQADRRSVSLTAPRLTFTNGQTANIYVATQLSFVSDLQPVTSDSSAAFDPTVAVVNDGVVLVIDGVVSADRRYVTLNVDAAISQVRRFDQQEISVVVGGLIIGSGTEASSFIQLPVVAVSRVQTTVTIPDQGTIMLGGQRLVSELAVETGVPVLSKIPILSRFFSNRVDSKEEQTLLILLKPTILIQNEQEEENFPGLLDALGG